MIFVSVGTYIQGFDELIIAMDKACSTYGFDAYAQIGNSAILPTHMRYNRFLTTDEMREALRDANLVVCHGGFGILGDAMRAHKPIIAVPRQNLAVTPGAPANNQLEVTRRLSQQYGIGICTQLDELGKQVVAALEQGTGTQQYPLGCNIPQLIGNYLKSH